MIKINKNFTGWLTFVVALSIIGLWSYWGINEAFHEGWLHASLTENLALTVIQYLSVPIIFLVISIVALYFKKTGFGLFIALGILALFFFDSNAGRILIFIPLVLLALGFYFGDYGNKKIFTISFSAIFLLIVLAFGLPGFIKVKNRFNDNDFGARLVAGNGISLVWAPEGDGWPLTGVNWQEAKDNCARLNEAGTGPGEEADIWRLPTREEIVRSLTRKNANAGGVLDQAGMARYEITPDKETPLWNPHSQIIYYWTGESAGENRAYLVAYNGSILERTKTSGPAYQGYRCVKEQ